MNAFDSESSETESLLRAARWPAPSAAHRERVLDAMGEAAGERRAIVAAHRPAGTPRATGPWPWILPEAAAGAAAALAVLVTAWLGQPAADGAAGIAAAPVALQGAGDPEGGSDVERALALLETRRHRFHASGLFVGPGIEPGDAPRMGAGHPTPRL